ncbi:hypothetical protein HUJ04_009392 [Dendroctonus ponderosae]|nr:hypothetical protein HUJ04_009392 [Dendroctonus ponderosae]
MDNTELRCNKLIWISKDLLYQHLPKLDITKLKKISEIFPKILHDFKKSFIVPLLSIIATKLLWISKHILCQHLPKLDITKLAKILKNAFQNRQFLAYYRSQKKVRTHFSMKLKTADRLEELDSGKAAKHQDLGFFLRNYVEQALKLNDAHDMDPLSRSNIWVKNKTKTHRQTQTRRKLDITEYAQTQQIEEAEWKDYFKRLYASEEQERLEEENAEPVEILVEVTTKIASKIKNRKAPGSDDIPNELLKEGGPLLMAELTKLFNKILTTRTIPNEWKKSIIIPIFKKGDKNLLKTTEA